MTKQPNRLVDESEIRTLLGGVSRQRLWQIMTRDDFPKPVADFSPGMIWSADDIDEWITIHRPDQTARPSLCASPEVARE